MKIENHSSVFSLRELTFEKESPRISGKRFLRVLFLQREKLYKSFTQSNLLEWILIIKKMIFNLIEILSSESSLKKIIYNAFLFYMYSLFYFFKLHQNHWNMSFNHSTVKIRFQKLWNSFQAANSLKIVLFNHINNDMKPCFKS